MSAKSLIPILPEQGISGHDIPGYGPPEHGFALLSGQSEHSLPDFPIHFEAIATGDETAFKRIVACYSPRLLSIAANITGSSHTAEDIVQEAFLELWRKRTRLTYDNTGGWLYTVVCNMSRKHVKKESRKTHLYIFLQKGSQHYCTGTEDHLVNRENMEAFHKAYSRLSRMQQKVYHLSREAGLSRNEIASHLNISPNTVKVHLLRAVQYIKQYIGAACLLFFFFLLNNIFFKSGNTKCPPGELYKVNHRVENTIPGKKNELPLRIAAKI